MASRPKQKAQHRASQRDEIHGNTTEEQNAVGILTDWYERDRQAKQFYNEEMREMYKLYKGDHWDLIGPLGLPLRTEEQQRNRPNCVENMTFSLVEGTASEFAQDVELVDFPVEEGDEDQAQKLTDIKKFIFYKNRIIKERIKHLRWFFLYGTGIWHTYWDPDWKGGRGPNHWDGDVRWKALHPIFLIPDARCQDDINAGQRVHKRIWRTVESIKEQYPERGHLIQEQMMSENEDFLDEEAFRDVYGDSSGEHTQGQAPVIETWYKGEPLILGKGEKSEGSGMHVIWWAGEGSGVYLNHSNYVYYEADETPKFPFQVAQCYPREGSIWGFGESYFLKNPQIMMNKTAEIILEGHMHSAVGQTLYQVSALTAKQRKIIEKLGTLPGLWLATQDINGIRREHAKHLPHTLQGEMLRIQKVMEAIIGRPDISQGKVSGQVTAFKAIAELSARAQVRLRIKEQALTNSYEEVGSYINRLVAKNYNEERRYRILGEGGQEYQRGTYRQDEMLKVYDTVTEAIIPFGEIIPADLDAEEAQDYLTELAKQSPVEGVEPEDRFEVYFPEFDTYCRVTSVVPSDRVYHMEMARELLVAGIIGPDVFLHVMEHGRFPPYEELKQQMEQKLMEQQAAAAAGVPVGAGGMPGAGVPALPPGAEGAPVPPEAGGMPMGEGQELTPEQAALLQEFIEDLPDEIKQQLANMSPQQQKLAVAELIEQSQGGGV